MLIGKLMYMRGLQRAVGPRPAFVILVRRLLRLRGPVNVRLLGLPSRPSVVLRPFESDLFVASQTAGWQDYELDKHVMTGLRNLAMSWRDDGIEPLIIDGGANVGYSAIYFAERFPMCTIIAVEPDLNTYRIMERNVADHGNIVPINAAIWSHSEGVELASSSDGSWATTSREATDGRALTSSMTLPELGASRPGSRTLILKLDIEGAEADACRVATSMLRSVPCLIVEPHDFMNPGSGCMMPLLSAVSDRQLDLLIRGENLVFLDSQLSAPALLAECDTATECIH